MLRCLSWGPRVFVMVLVGGAFAVLLERAVPLSAAVPSGYVEETVAVLDRPVAIAFLPDGRLLVGSQGSVAAGEAKIYVYKDGAVLAVPYAVVTDVYLGNGEAGLLGLAVDPNFASNGFVYAFITVSTTNQVVRRFTTVGDVGTSPVDLITNLPTAGQNHNGGGLLILGNHLYVSVGENGTPDASQITTDMRGKVLRFNLDGSVPPDNPFGPGNPVWSYGLRNPFRIAARPGTGQIFATENGPAGFDEINHIVRGGNYGWPLYTGYTDVPGFVSPIWSSGLESGIVPTDLLFYHGSAMPEFDGQLFVAGWSVDTIYRATVAADGNSLVGGLIPFVTVVDQPVDLEIGPDGALWYCTRPGFLRRVVRGGGGGDNVAPTASFTRTPSSGPPPLTVMVNASASFDSDGVIANYHWDWGDGTNPRSGPTRVTAGHVYRTSGVYTITLTVTDNDGATASSSQPVVVSASGNNPPSAHIENVSAFRGAAPLTVDFSGHGHDGDGDLLRYDWDFGDGSPVVTQLNMAPDTNVFLSHTFTEVGNVIVRLTVTDGGGLSATNTAEITVTSGGDSGGGENLLADPGFEQGGTGWLGIGGDTGIVTDPVHAGALALRMVASSSRQVVVEQTVPVSAGVSYDVSAWVKTDRVDGGTVITVTWLDVAGRSLSADRGAVYRGTRDWTREFVTVVPPTGAASARLSLRLVREADNIGVAWYDDVGISPRP